MPTKRLLPVALLLVLGAAACGGPDKSGDPRAAAPFPAASSITIGLSETEVGQVLTDNEGRVLYAFTKDRDGASNCGDSCVAVWPALTATRVQPGSGSAAALIGRTQRGEGVTQVRYGTWPLYSYAGNLVRPTAP
jgi:predicted lipoprotein with Yx(FWY)xxD motif